MCGGLNPTEYPWCVWSREEIYCDVEFLHATMTPPIAVASQPSLFRMAKFMDCSTFATCIDHCYSPSANREGQTGSGAVMMIDMKAVGRGRYPLMVSGGEKRSIVMLDSFMPRRNTHGKMALREARMRKQGNMSVRKQKNYDIIALLRNGHSDS